MSLQVNSFFWVGIERHKCTMKRHFFKNGMWLFGFRRLFFLRVTPSGATKLPPHPGLFQFEQKNRM
jgi:hypothetical protein